MSGVLEGKVALVTGGSRGLGAAMVRAFAREGSAVVIASRKIDACVALATEVSEEFDVETFAVAANVSHWDECDALVDSCYRRFEAIDLLVNNAGVSPLYPSLADVTEALFDKVIAVNLRGPFRLMSLVGARMAAGSGGSIINISSIEAIRPESSALTYAAAKAGLEALASGFAHALGPAVRVNTLRCGLFRTDSAKAWGTREEIDQMAAERTVLQRIGEPLDIVGAALFLATDASAYCTGTTIDIHGGVR